MCFHQAEVINYIKYPIMSPDLSTGSHFQRKSNNNCNMSACTKDNIFLTHVLTLTYIYT